MSRSARDNPTVKLLRQRRIVRGGVFGIVTLLIILVVVDHLGAFGYPGDDWRQFDHKSVVVTRVIDGDTICVRDVAGSRETHVRLLGVDAPELHLMTTHVPDFWAERARTYAAARMTGKTVTLRTE